MTDYVIGLWKLHPLVATVAKFEGSPEPTKVYQVEQMASGRMRCNCHAYLLGGKRPCKHGLMVLEHVTKRSAG